MIFSEKMKAVPQPHRAELWNQYRILCTALALQVTLKKEGRLPTEKELTPLKIAAKKANEILDKHGMEPSFFPEQKDFFELLVSELTEIRQNPSKKD